MSDPRNQAILMTAAGPAAIGIVRLLGPEVRAFLQEHFSRPVAPSHCVHGLLRDGELTIDDPVIVLSPDGSWADVNLHGGSWVMRRALALAERAGFSIIEGGEALTAAAKMDGENAIDVAMHAALPLARTKLALRLLLAQPKAWRDLSAAPSPPSRESSLRSCSDDRALFWLLNPPRVAIVGAANVGKSTLANQLFARDVAITADEPGTTRDWVGEFANVDDLPVMLVDTPGMRSSDDAIEMAAIDASAGQIATAALVVLVLDLSRPLTGEQQALLHRFPAALRVLNKADRVATWDAASAGGLQTIALSGSGVPALRGAIRRHFLGDLTESDEPKPRWWTPSQRKAILDAIDDPSSLSRWLVQSIT